MGGLPNTDTNAWVNACCRVRLFASAYSLMFISLSFYQGLGRGFRVPFPRYPQSSHKPSILYILYHLLAIHHTLRPKLIAELPQRFIHTNHFSLLVPSDPHELCAFGDNDAHILFPSISLT